MKKLCVGLLALALSTISCKHIYDIDPYPNRSYCFYLHLEAKEVAGERKDSDMIKELLKDNWCNSHKRSLNKDIDILEDYINSQD